MNHTHNDVKSNERPKSAARIKFQKMLEEQEQQIKNNKHITSLLNPDQNKVSLEEKVENIEGLIKGLYQTRESSPAPKEVKTVNVDMTPKRIYLYSISIIIAGLLIGIGFSLQSENKRPTIADKSAQKEIIKSNQLVLVKYGNLRSRASQSGKIIKVLHPNHIVESIQTKGEWQKVKFFDYSQQKEIIGWLYQTTFKVLNQ